MRKPFDHEAWFEKARAYGSINDSWFEVKKGTLEYNEWSDYFNVLGWTPYTFSNMHLNKEKSFTAPCQWPKDLDLNVGRSKSRWHRKPKREDWD